MKANNSDGNTCLLNRSTSSGEEMQHKHSFQYNIVFYNDKLTKLNADMIRLLGWISSCNGAFNALPTLLFGPAGNICAPLTPQSYAEFGPGPEVVQPVWPESRDGSVQGQIGLHPLRGRKNVSVA